MKHDHTVEVRIPDGIEDAYDKTLDHLETNKQAYLFGLGGLVVGFIGARLFQRAPVQIIVNNITD